MGYDLSEFSTTKIRTCLCVEREISQQKKRNHFSFKKRKEKEKKALDGFLVGREGWNRGEGILEILY
ncbi:hypothetical protein ACE6H2_004177 [Prunus campanulata]